MQQIRLKEEEERRSESERRKFVVIYSTFQIDLEPYLCARGERIEETADFGF